MGLFNSATKRLSLLLILFAGMFLASPPAPGANCPSICTNQRNICTEGCGSLLTCVDACFNAWGACIKNCQ